MIGGAKGFAICKPNAIAEQEIVELIPAKLRASELTKIVKTLEINENNLQANGATHFCTLQGVCHLQMLNVSISCAE